MDKKVKQAISDELDGILFLGRLTFAALAFGYAWIAWTQPDFSGADIYFFVAGPLVIFQFLSYTCIEIYLLIAKPVTVHSYTFYAAFRIWLLAIFMYIISFEYLMWFCSYSEKMKLMQLFLIGAGFWGVLFYFRYVFLPKRFKAANGLQQAIENKVLDPEKALYRIGVEWTRAVVNPQSFERSTFMERYPWFYAVIIGGGAAVLSIYEFDRLDYFSIGGTFFGALSIFFSIMVAFSWHDHVIIRQWEKEHGKVLSVKA